MAQAGENDFFSTDSKKEHGRGQQLPALFLCPIRIRCKVANPPGLEMSAIRSIAVGAGPCSPRLGIQQGI